MKTSRFRFDYRENCSKLHKAVGDCIRSSEKLGSYRTYQEYPVVRVNPSYYKSSHHFDWVILDLKLVIECHGEQHYKPVSFGNMSKDAACIAFSSQKHRDRQKEWAATDAGWTYIAIPYWDQDKISEEYILGLYRQNLNDQPIIKTRKFEESQYDKDIKNKAREYRKQQYRRQKENLDKLKRRSSDDS